MRRIAPLLVSAAMLVSLLGGPAGAQSQEEVDEAQRSADAAADLAARASAEYEGLQGSLSSTELVLLETLEAHRIATFDLEAATFQVIGLVGEIESTEIDVEARRDRADLAVAEAYMQAAGTGGAFWLTDSVSDASIVAGSLAHVRVDAETAVADLATHRLELGELHSVYQASQDDLVVRRSALDASRARLQALFEELGTAVAEAFENVGVTDAAYRAALDEVAKQERRYNAMRGVEGWRTLVETHFPNRLVGQALEVMRCESRGNPDATNPTSGAAGLFQFLEGTWAWASVSAGYGGASRYDPDPNVATAAWLVSHSVGINDPRGPWAHWECQPNPTS